jgi:phospholipase C
MKYRLLLCLCAAIGIVSSGCSGERTNSSGSLLPLSAQNSVSNPRIGHVVIIVQENRTPDNLFQGLPGADIATSGLNSHGQRVPLRPIELQSKIDLDHTHRGFEREYNGGKMNGFDREHGGCGNGPCAPPQVRAYSYVRQEDVAPYFTMARRFTFGDRMFQSNEGPSFPAHQYIISGTSTPRVGSRYRASENPGGSARVNEQKGGCDSPAGTLVKLIDKRGVETARTYPCFERPTLADLLEARGHTWRYYQQDDASGFWNAFDAIKHLWKRPDYNTHVIFPSSQVLTDIKAGNLADVTWVTPADVSSDHPGWSDGSGPSWVASVVNAVGESQYWKDTAIFIVWDDWGGWYDHVKPPVFDSYELGFRVPLIVISPYAKAHYVSHTSYEFGSILKFVERTYGLGSLASTDARAANLSDCFDFTQKPIRFRPIPVTKPMNYFLHRVTPRVAADETD